MSTGRILIVDDEPGVRELLRTYLESVGYTCVEAANGVEALRVLAAGGVAAMITDVNMPEMNGMDLLHEAQRRQPQLGVIMITGMPTVDGAVSSLKAGAIDYLSKPFNLPAVKDLVAKVIAAAQPPAAPTPTDTAETSAVERTVVMTPEGRRHIGQYEVQWTIGEGNMGSVFLVRRPGDPEKRDLALKLLKPQWLNDAQRDMVVERFLREAKVSSSVSHPNIIRIHEYGISEPEGLPYLVMDYLPGQSLRWYIGRKKAMPWPKRIELLQQVAAALVAMHAVGICHRDVKPANIMITPQGQAVLTDFGIARLPDSNLTMTACLMGSPAYLAPEGFLSAKVDARADLFSLGVVGYEFCLGGRKPFEGETIAALAMRIRTEKPVEPRKLVPDFPPLLQDVLGKLLRKTPEERYQTAAEVVRDLAAAAEQPAARSARRQSFFGMGGSGPSDWA